MLVCALAFVLGFASCAKDSNDSNGGNSGTNPFLGSWVSQERVESVGDMFLKLVFNDYNVSMYAGDGNSWYLGYTESYLWSGNSMQIQANEGVGWRGTIVSNGVILLDDNVTRLYKQ